MLPHHALFNWARPTALAAGILLLLPGWVRSRNPAPRAEGRWETVADSSSLHRRARDAQREFETIHRRHLPRATGPWTSDCDEYVGNLCLTGNDLAWRPAPEDPAVTQGRTHLLDVLAEVGQALPGDRWVLGQRIRYLGNTGRWTEALDVAHTCVPQGSWWCLALQGYVLHRSGDVVTALEAFSLALAAMDPDQSEEWRDPGPILGRRGGGWLKDPRPLTGDGAESRFWTFADPLFLTPGNERLSEHFARRFATDLYEKTALTMGIPWGRGFEELLLRYGFVAGWEEARPGIRRSGRPNVIQHYHPEARGLLPPFEALEDPAGLPQGVWVPVDERPRTSSAPIGAPLVAEGQAQTAILRRDGNLLVVASYGLPRDTVFLNRRSPVHPSPGESQAQPIGGRGPGRPLWEAPVQGVSSDTLAGIFLLPDTGGKLPLAALGSGVPGVLQVLAPPGGYLLSFELWAPADRWAARVRHGVLGLAIPRGVPHLSDLLVLATGDDLPRSLPEALPRLRPNTDVESGVPLTVGWEVYGLGAEGESITFGLSLVDEEGSLIRRALNLFGLFRKDPILTLSWREAGATGPGPLFRAVDVDLPPMAPGRYVLRLEMKLPYRNPVVSNRRVRVF